MKRSLSVIFMLLAIAAGTSAQAFQKSVKRNTQLAATNESEWIKYCQSNPENVTGVGTGSSGTMLSQAVFFNKDFISAHQGKQVSAVAIHVYAALRNADIFIKTGNDINYMESDVFTHTVNNLYPGWNIIKLNTPVTINSTAGMAVTYEAKEDANYPMAFDGNTLVPGTSFISNGGSAYEESQAAWGNAMIGAYIGEDLDALANKVTMLYASCPGYVASGTSPEFKLELGNPTFTEIKDITLKYTANGIESEKNVTFSTPIAAHNSSIVTIDMPAITETTVYTFGISAINGVAQEAVSNIVEAVQVYDPSQTTPRKILIEKFTGQACGYCPGGGKSIDAAIKGMEDRVVRIDHHYGYGEDIFTIQPTREIGGFFGVRGAPNCMVDRTIQEERKSWPEGNGIYWHPGYMTSDLIANEIARPAFISVVIDEPQFDIATRELTVRVSGKALKDLSGAKLNVVITQSGYEAYQNSGGVGYKHNDFPLYFCTSYTGDAITFGADGTYEATYKQVIAPKAGNKDKVKVDLTKLKVVAFVSYWKKTDTSEVLNAESAVINPGDLSGVNTISSDNARIHIDGRNIVAEGNAELSVYTVSGKKVGATNLQPGVYVVKVKSAGQTQTEKIIIR